MNWCMQLDKTRGSRPRCVSIMEGPRAEVAQRLTRLVALPDVTVSPDHKWMPRGTPRQKPDGTWDTSPADEAKLAEPNELLPSTEQEKLRTWWLEHSARANIPNWDIASTCRAGDKDGLLLIEAKAHEQELRGEERGKDLGDSPSDRSFANHLRIGHAIADASAHLQCATNLRCAISRDDRYQMSNRFTWATKLTELGYPVILVYLGFLKATEMANPGVPFASPADWDDLVKSHSAPLFPAQVWNREWKLHGQSFNPLIRSIEWPLTPGDAP